MVHMQDKPVPAAAGEGRARPFLSSCRFPPVHSCQMVGGFLQQQHTRPCTPNPAASPLLPPHHACKHDHNPPLPAPPDTCPMLSPNPRPHTPTLPHLFPYQSGWWAHPITTSLGGAPAPGPVPCELFGPPPLAYKHDHTPPSLHPQRHLPHALSQSPFPPPLPPVSMSKWLVGSSSNSKFGRGASTRASAMRAFWPPLRLLRGCSQLSRPPRPKLPK